MAGSRARSARKIPSVEHLVHLVPSELALRKLNLKTLNFLNGGLIGTPFAADGACELHCQECR
jgi:hypothetical protein